jgi:hypothetical protein
MFDVTNAPSFANCIKWLQRIREVRKVVHAVESNKKNTIFFVFFCCCWFPTQTQTIRISRVCSWGTKTISETAAPCLSKKRALFLSAKSCSLISTSQWFVVIH